MATDDQGIGNAAPASAASPFEALRAFFRMEAAGGIALVLAAVLGVIAANSSLAVDYEALLVTKAEVRIGTLGIAKPLLLWINDGLMAVFFLLVGIEIKREFRAGELASPRQAALPVIAAAGGMVVPAAIYAAINLAEPQRLQGWAIPAATDIAFALGVLALLGRRVPLALKVLLTAIAIIDDLGAIIIIAVFYTAQLSLTALALAGAAGAVLCALNLCGVRRLAPYVIAGAALWLFLVKSGVHATLAGVVLAIAIPMGDRADGHCLLESVERGLHSWVAFAILPIFGFANAGVSFAGVGWSSLAEPVTLGIALGLCLGKPIGVYASLRLAIGAGLARLPGGTTWGQLLGLSILCGIGFTMSLFIGGLAWEHGDFDAPVRLGVIAGSLVSAFAGTLVLLAARPVAGERTGERA